MSFAPPRSGGRRPIPLSVATPKSGGHLLRRSDAATGPLFTVAHVDEPEVLNAGVEILENQGHEALTIAAVCERAGVTPPTLYARAPDKQALMLAVHEHAVARLESTIGLRGEAGPDESVRAVARGFLTNARLLRAIMRQASTEPEIFRRGSESIIDLGHRFRAAVGGDERRADACLLVQGPCVRRGVRGCRG